MSSKSIETKAVFTKTEVNNKWNVDFIQNDDLVIQHTYSSTFPLVTAPLKFLIWHIDENLTFIAITDQIDLSTRIGTSPSDTV